MLTTPRINVRDSTKADRVWMHQLLERAWGSTSIARLGRLIDAASAPAVVAELDDKPSGLSTYVIHDGRCEMLTLNSTRPRLGIGIALVQAVIDRARAADCHTLWLITTNDNQPAITLYERCGFTVTAVYHDSIKNLRQLKPDIPRVGYAGRPIRDEIEMQLDLR